MNEVPSAKIDKTICQQILTIGIDWRKIRGGVAAVEQVYASFFDPFKFVPTVVDGNKLVKALVVIRAVILFVWKLSTDKAIKIVHVHGSSNASFWRKRIFIRIAKWYGKKVVYHCHGAIYKEFTAEHRKAVHALIDKVDCVIALSESWREWFIEEFGCPYVVVLKNVIPAPQKQACHHNDGKVHLLFLGMLGHRKGIYDLLDVLIANKAYYQDKVCLHIGGNGEVDKVKAIIAKEQIGDWVIYEGWVGGDQKIQLLNEADVYVLPSYNEGLPISVLEALSYELPAISTNVGGIPEIVKDGYNGCLIEPGDKEALKRALDSLIGDKALREEMGKRSPQVIEQHLPAYVAKQLTALYSILLRPDYEKRKGMLNKVNGGGINI